MTELTGVISSTALAQPKAAVSDACPRKLLGLTCLRSHYECLCEQVTGSEVETVKGGKGASALVLTLRLIPNVGNPLAVMTALNLTGYKADFQASRQAVTATFNLRKPQNSEIAALVQETGI